ncbi:hypothetical protein APA_3796 [Pseudanabaena sp. lw0831]|nr:hypothetical protein APA_3796 [Pseudanabaena sp. lw0831]
MPPLLLVRSLICDRFKIMDLSSITNVIDRLRDSVVRNTKSQFD